VVRPKGVGGLLNATFGNAAELIIALVALRAGLHDAVEALIAGSIVGNMLLVLGAAMLAGGLRHPEQHFNPGGVRAEATMLTLAVIALILPAKRSYYGVPYTVDVFLNHVWRPLVERAGYKMEDIPKNWDAFDDFFEDVQKKLREQGMRHVYGLGFQVTTNGGDCNAFFNQFLIAYGGRDIVTPDGKLRLDARRQIAP
jgi:Sodium/calcium exchanger protein